MTRRKALIAVFNGKRYLGMKRTEERLRIIKRIAIGFFLGGIFVAVLLLCLINFWDNSEKEE